MMQFNEETARRLKSACRRHKTVTAVSALLAVALCVLSVCLLELLGRTFCQIAATALTGLFGCVLLTKLQAIRRAKRLIALCEKPGTPISGTVNAVDEHTVTLHRLKFRSLEVDTGAKRVILYLYDEGTLPALAGRKITANTWDHILLTWEVVQ